jgi:hypothetical protein
MVAGLTISGLGQAPAAPTSTAAVKRLVRPAHLSYTAEYKETWVRKLSNGETSTYSVIEGEAVDADWRLLHSTTSILPSGALAPTTYFSLSDLAQSHTSWMVIRPGERGIVLHRATVQYPLKPDAVSSCKAPVALTAAAQPASPTPEGSATKANQATADAQPAPPTADDQAARVHEGFNAIRAQIRLTMPPELRSGDLGFKTIKGIEVRGHRFTTTVPAGARGINNAGPLEKTFEQWLDTTPGLQSLMVLQVIDDPEVHYTKELETISLGEPDPTLFQPPADYEIVVQKPPACHDDGGTGSKPQAIHPQSSD